jgi:peptidoglycan/LPS O-acetylase OafA/YrhL
VTPRGAANNFDLLRAVAATSVIFSHAFLLAEGRQNNEPLVALTGQAVLGLMGVFVFFVISGFLVTQSYDNTRSLPRFLLKRALRIYPGLFVCLLFCALVIGAAVSVLPLGDYYRESGVYRFVEMNLLMETHHNTLPTVIFTGFGVGAIVNGPLWSLPYELAMYGMVAVLGRFGLLRPRIIAVLWLVGIAAALWDTSRWKGAPWEFPGGFLWLLGFFTAGMLMQKLKGDWLFDRRLALLAVIGLVAAARLHALIALFPIFGAFLVIHLALDPRLPRVPAARYGDLSYGLYIYGWPVEQTILWLCRGKLLWWELFLTALPAAAALAYLSWHLVERPALSLKPRPALRRLRPLPCGPGL